MKHEDTEIWVDEPDGAQEASGDGRSKRRRDTDLGMESVRISRKERKRLAEEIPGGEKAPWDGPDGFAEQGRETNSQTAATGPDKQTEAGQPAAEKPAGHEPRRGKGNAMAEVLSGSILSKSEVRRAYPYMVFVACLMFLYIANIFRTQYIYREHSRLTEEVKELRAKSMTIASDKMKSTRQSSVMRELERRGISLRESLTPNKVIPRDDPNG